jgi:probable addiction module antidote protein
MTKKACRPFEVGDFDLLKNPEQAALYLAECYEEGEEMFQLALRDVARAQKGGISGVAETAGLNRTNLYRSLSKTGSPNFKTIKKMVDALGLKMKLSFEPKGLT